jgi:hypothetical protein
MLTLSCAREHGRKRRETAKGRAVHGRCRNSDTTVPVIGLHRFVDHVITCPPWGRHVVTRSGPPAAALVRTRAQNTASVSVDSRCQVTPGPMAYMSEAGSAGGAS